MKLKNLPATNIAIATTALAEACPGITGEIIIAALRSYEPNVKPVEGKREPLRMLSVKQFGERFQISRGKVFELIKTGKVRRILLGKRTARIPESEANRLFHGEVI